MINHSRFPSKFPIGHLKEISPRVRLLMLFVLLYSTFAHFPLYSDIAENKLELKIQTNTGEQVINQYQLNSTLAEGYLNQETTFATASTIGRISFVNFASFIRNSSIGSELEEIPFSMLGNESNSNTSSFVLRFPGYFVSVLYDPDFSVLLNPRSSSGDGKHTLAQTLFQIPALTSSVSVLKFFRRGWNNESWSDHWSFCGCSCCHCHCLVGDYCWKPCVVDVQVEKSENAGGVGRTHVR